MSRRVGFAWLLALLGGCAGVQSALDPAGDQASIIRGVWYLMLIVCGFMLVLTFIFMGWAVLTGRRNAKRARDASGEAKREHALSITLYGWIALVVAGLIVLTLGSFLADRHLLARAPDPLHVRITGNQWWWDVEYPGQQTSDTVHTANELHLPADQPAEIELQTTDVIHSLWIPNLAGKLDLIPGRVNTLRVTPRRVGRLRGQCAEFCGLQHAWMALDVVIDTPDEFEKWRKHQLEAAPAPTSDIAKKGEEVFTSKPCVMCHAIVGTHASARVGPDLTHIASRKYLGSGARELSRDNLRAWVLDPQRIKPGVHMPAEPLSQHELDALVDYLLTLD